MENLLSKIKKILHGIDQEELLNKDGWWETNAGAEFGRDVLVKIESLFETNTWQDHPTENGYWLMHDRWLGKPELMTVLSYGQRGQTITITATNRVIKRQGMINTAKWYGPITPPEGDKP